MEENGNKDEIAKKKQRKKIAKQKAMESRQEIGYGLNHSVVRLEE